MCQVSPIALDLRTFVLLICGDAPEERVHKPEGIGSVCSQYGRGGWMLFQICFKFNLWKFGVAQRKFVIVLLGRFSH